MQSTSTTESSYIKIQYDIPENISMLFYLLSPQKTLQNNNKDEKLSSFSDFVLPCVLREIGILGLPPNIV